MDRYELRRQARMAMRGVPERLGLRFADGRIEMRAKPNGTAAGSNFEWNGYATVYGADFDMWDQNGDPFTESVAAGAAKRSLANPALDVPFLIGHNDAGIPLARTKSGTMKLSEDSHGVFTHVPAMDGRREEVRALASAVERGDLDEMSLAFVCLRQAWDDNYEHRTVMEMDLHRGDVCAVTHGANPATAGASMRPSEQLSFRRPAAIGGPVLLERRAAMSLAVQHGHPGQPCLDPDGDGDCDLTPEGDTDHDYWSADGRQLQPLPGEELSAGMPLELRASAADNLDVSAVSDYDAAAADHPPMTGVHTHPVRHSHDDDASHAASATVTVDAATGIPGEESQYSAARDLDRMRRELELEELACRRREAAYLQELHQCDSAGQSPPGHPPSWPVITRQLPRRSIPISAWRATVPDDGLTGQLEQRRSSLVAANRELLTASAARPMTAEETTAYDGNMTEIRSLNQRLDDLADQAQREERARAARADGTAAVVDDHGSGARASGVQVTGEPMVYGQHSGNSYWLDLGRDATGRGDVQGARERLGRHRAELDVELPKRRERRAREARGEIERLHARSRREELALERFYGGGGQVFETRAINRTDGTGGYFVPPLWLIDMYAPYLRAGRTLANMCHSIPLPGGTDSINMPIITTGTAAGPQTADGGAVPGRDMADNYVNALVRTVAGQEDVAIQLLDQSPIAFDNVISQDLMQDHAIQVDGQVLLGSGSSGQITGMYSHGTITGGSTEGIIVNTVTGTTTSQWVGTNSFYQGMGKLLSQIARNRYRQATGVVTNPAAWYAQATAVDGNSRPLVVPAAQGPWNTVAEFDPGAAAEGPVGSILGRPWLADNNIPLTFGGASTNPSMSTTSAGHVSPTDGTGSGNTFTPAIAAVWDDLLLFEGEIRTRVLQEILSGTLQVRFQIYNYLAFLPNRYQDGSGKAVSYGNANSGTTAGAALSTGASGGLVGF